MAKAELTHEGDTVLISCPACNGMMHGLGIDKSKQPCWGFNGDFDKPTFTPSLRVQYTQPITDDERDRIMNGEKINKPKVVCHSFIRDGQIQYCNDSTHHMAGQTAELLEVDT
jgi:hypothetical protein